MLRVCGPQWSDPLAASFSRVRGGRWNARGSFAVLYLNADERTARANVARRFRDLPYGPEDLFPSAQPEFVAVGVAESGYADCESLSGVMRSGLPATYPLTAGGDEVGWDRCQPIGQAAFDEGLAGVACRSAAGEAAADLREVAHFARATDARPELLSRIAFSAWFWTAPAA